MTASEADAPAEPWSDPILAAAILAVRPAALSIRLAMRAGPAREAWLALLRTLLPDTAPLRRCPANITDDRLLGGLDLPASLAAGARINAPGLLAECDGGVLVLAMAERMSSGLAARLGQVLESGFVQLERDGFTGRMAASVGLVALDESGDEDPGLPAALADRIALVLSPDDRHTLFLYDAELATLLDQVVRARGLLDAVILPEPIADALCRTALAAGVASLRPPLLALRIARILAALRGATLVDESDAALAARLVLAPRATRLPELDSQPDADDAPPPSDSGPDDSPDPDPETDSDLSLDDITETVLQAVRAALPPDLLVRLRTRAGASLRKPGANAGGRLEAGGTVRQAPPRRGRPIGAVPGDLARGRLNLPATLRAALPWQRLRQAETARSATVLQVRRPDIRLTRFAPRVRLTTIFLVDASGSSARARLAEAKGCVALLLADCYARRDQVALVVFRGTAATLVLPPTGAMARASRVLDGLPGGGGTPLAAGLDLSLELALSRRRQGEPSLLVLLTDGRANIARDGTPGRVQAHQDALSAASRVREAGLPCLLIDISARAGHTQPGHTQPADPARQIADAMAARHLSLPQADAAGLNRAVRAALPR